MAYECGSSSGRDLHTELSREVMRIVSGLGLVVLNDSAIILQMPDKRETIWDTSLASEHQRMIDWKKIPQKVITLLLECFVKRLYNKLTQQPTALSTWTERFQGENHIKEDLRSTGR